MNSMLYVPPEIVDEATKQSNPRLDIPLTAATKGRPGAKGFTAKWTEMVEVVDSKVEEVEQKENKPAGRWTIIVFFRVAAESVDPTNVGKPLRAQFFMNPSQLGNKGSKEYQMTIISLGKLNNLLRTALSVDVAGQGVDYESYFGGDNPPIVGAKLYATVKHTEGEEYPQEVVAFSSLTESP